MRASVFAVAVLSSGLAACSAAPVVEYDARYESAIAFGKNLVSAMSLGAGKQVSKLYNRESTAGEVNIFTAKFFPESGPEGVMSSFANYCSGIKGAFRGGLCSEGAELSGYFYVRLVPTGIVVSGVAELNMEVVEAINAPSSQVVQLAQQRGFVTKMEALTSQYAAQQQEKRRLDALEAEIDRRKQLSVKTRALVLEKGTQVCPVNLNDPVCNKWKCYTEDSNRDTNRVKVSALGNLRWEDASSWFACH